MMTKEESTKIINFMTSGAGDLSLVISLLSGGCLMLGRGYMSHYNEYALFSIVSIYINIYITSIANVLSEYMPLSYATVDSHLFHDVAADMQI